MLCGTPVGAVARTIPGGQVWFGLACDDLWLVGLKLMFLVVSRVASVLGLSRLEAWWKDVEILMLRHQLVVALRERLNSLLNNVARAHAKRFRHDGQEATRLSTLPKRPYISVWTASRTPKTKMNSAA